jgi:hypothetical protein
MPIVRDDCRLVVYDSFNVHGACPEFLEIDQSILSMPLFQFDTLVLMLQVKEK